MLNCRAVLPLLLALSLAAAGDSPANKPAPMSLAAPGINYANIDPGSGDAFLDYFTQQLSLKGGIRIITRNEVTQLIGLERQRQLLTCDEKGTSCVTEMAGALGTDGVITGSLAKLGSNFVVNIKIISAVNAQPFAIYSKRVPNEDALLAFLDESATDFANKHGTGANTATTASATTTSTTTNTTTTTSNATQLTTSVQGNESAPSHGWVYPAIGGAALAAGSATFFLLANGNHAALTDKATSLSSEPNVDRAVNAGRTQQTVGVALGAGALAAEAAAVALLATRTTSETEPKKTWLAPAAAGLGLAAGSVALFSMANQTHETISNGQNLRSAAQLEGVTETGKLQQTLGVAFAAGAVAAEVGAVVMLFTSPKTQTSAALVPLNGGAALCFSGALP